MRCLLLLCAALAACACEPVDHCEVNETRCSGPLAQVCDSDERWVEIMNCDEVAMLSGGGPWSCQALEDDGGHTCLPVEDDPDAGGQSQ